MNPKEITKSSEFRKIAHARWRVSLGLTAVMIGAYFSYILILAKKKDLLAIEMGNGLPIGIPVGVGLIVLAWVLTGIYIVWANSFHDEQVKELKKSLER